MVLFGKSTKDAGVIFTRVGEIVSMSHSVASTPEPPRLGLLVDCKKTVEVDDPLINLEPGLA